jgi:two-component system response regulator MprA
MRDRILIVDDDPYVGRFLRRALTRAEYAVSVATEGREAVALAAQEQPAVILLDVMLPDLDGMRVLQRLRETSNAVVIMLTARGDTDTRVGSLDLGADDYVTKPFELSELLARIRAQLRRYRADGANRLRFADLDVDPLARTARRGQRFLPLTPREFRILLVFLRQPRRVIDRATLFDEAWPEGAEEQSNAVEAHLHRLREKLHGPGEPPLLHTVRGVGYVLRESIN